MWVIMSLREVVEEWRRFLQLNRRKSYHGVLRRRFWDLFAGEKVFGEEFTGLEEFWRSPTGLADGSVVIVAGGVRLEGPVAPGPQAEGGATVRHINAKGDSGLEHVDRKSTRLNSSHLGISY